MIPDLEIIYICFLVALFRMVAEPVQATISTLRQLYYSTANFLEASQERIMSFGTAAYSSSTDISQTPPARTPTIERMMTHFRYNRWAYLTILSVGIGSVAYMYGEPPKPRKKRRAPKLANGARRDVILIVGSPTVPLTRIIALDFERRGLIVYITILDDKDQRYVESNPITDDMNYLNLRDVSGLEVQLKKFQQLLELPVIPFSGAQAHTLKLVGVVFTPNMCLPLGPIETMSINTWRIVNERLILFVQLLSHGLIDVIRKSKANTLLVHPSITSSLSLPYHGPETVFYNELKCIFTTLSRELAPQSISVTQVRLGNLQVTNRNTQARISSMVSSEIRNWDDETKDLYAESFARSQQRTNPINTKGTQLKELYHKLFDLVYGTNNSRVVYCGTGARSYDILASILPISWVDFILRT